MRSILPALFALTCVISCAAKEKPAEHATAATLPPPPPPVLRLKPGGPAVSFTMPDGWRTVASKVDEATAIMMRHDRNIDMAAVMISETEPTDKLEEVTTAWAMKVSQTLKTFHVMDLDKPIYVSDEESRFIIRGEDDANRKMMLMCLIKHVGANNADFWAITLVTGLTADIVDLTAAGDRIVNSVHIVPQPTP